VTSSSPRVRRFTRLTTLAAAAIAVTLLSSCSSSSGTPANKSSSGDNTIRATYAPTSAWLPVVIADQKGIFAKNGLTVKLTRLQNVDTAIGALGKQFDITAETATGVIQAAGHGIDIKVIAGNTVETSSNQQLSLLVKASSALHSYADLSHKSIGAASLTGATHIATLEAMKKAGLDVTAVRTVETGFAVMGDQLAAGNVDAVEDVQPFTGGLLKAGTVRSLGDPLMTMSGGQPVPLTLWAAGGSWADSHADQIAKWRTSLDQAASYIAQNPAQARQVLQQVTGLPPAVTAVLLLPQSQTTIDAPAVQTWVDASKDVGEPTGSTTGAKLVVGS